MKFRNTLQLGVLLAVLAGVYFGVQIAGENEAKSVQEAKRVFDFDVPAIKSLTVQRLDEQPTTATQDEPGKWSITEPNPKIKAFGLLWDRVAKTAAELKNERSLPKDALDLEGFGLAIPRLSITLDTGSGPQTLRFGYLEPTQTNRYARLDDGPVFLVNKDAVFEMDRPLALLRDSFVLDNPDAPLVRFEFARIMTAEQQARFENPPPLGEESEMVIVMERADASKPWVQTSPVETAANQDLVNEIVNEIQAGRGQAFIDTPESLADYGLDPASARITVVDNAEGHPQTFFFGNSAMAGEDGGVYVQKAGDPGVFLFDPHITALFPRTANALRERRLFTGQAKDIAKISYIGANHAYTLNRDDQGAWRMVDPPLDDTDDFYVSQFLGALKLLEGLDFYPGGPAEYGLDQPEARIQFYMAGATEPAEIRLTPNPADPTTYYALMDSGEVTSLPAEHIKFLLEDAQAFRNRALLRFQPTRAEKMSFQYEGVDYRLEKLHNHWLVMSPENHIIPNQKDAESLLKAVAELRALGSEDAPETDPATFGFDAPRFTFDVTLTAEEAGGAPETLGPLTIGEVVPNIDQQRFAKTAARSGVFRVKQSFMETVAATVSGIRPSGGALRSTGAAE